MINLSNQLVANRTVFFTKVGFQNQIHLRKIDLSQLP
jgi:hypothetical protein